MSYAKRRGRGRRLIFHETREKKPNTIGREVRQAGNTSNKKKWPRELGTEAIWVKKR